ncbi:MAG: hypothetical protein HQ530_02510 [Parcubacteria group bacterium]|nr:hypothetical protein [Parcubacteria group bacterium]
MKRIALWLVLSGLVLPACTRGNLEYLDTSVVPDQAEKWDLEPLPDVRPVVDAASDLDGVVIGDQSGGQDVSVVDIKAIPDVNLLPDLTIPQVDGGVKTGGILPNGKCAYKVWTVAGQKKLRYCDAGGLNVNSFVLGGLYGCKLAVPKQVVGETDKLLGKCLVIELADVNIQAYDKAQPICQQVSGYQVAVPVYLVSTAPGVFYVTSWLGLASCTGESGTKTMSRNGSLWVKW